MSYRRSGCGRKCRTIEFCYYISVCCQGDYKSQKEAVWAVTNLTSGGTMEQIGFLVNLGVIPHICNMLTVKESKVVLVILDALGNVLLVGAGSPLLCRYIFNADIQLNKLYK